MAAMASLASPALSMAPAHRDGVEGALCAPSGGQFGAQFGVQLRRSSEFPSQVAVRGGGRRRARRGVEFGGAVRGFSEPGGDESAVEGLPPNHDVPNISVRSHAAEMKKGYGAFGGGGATLEKSKLDLSQSTARVKHEVRG